jgi:hypothetical protein
MELVFLLFKAAVLENGFINLFLFIAVTWSNYYLMYLKEGFFEYFAECTV